MKRKYKLLLSTIGLLSIGIASAATAISCNNGSNTTSSNKNTKQNDNSTKAKDDSTSSSINKAVSGTSIINAITTYFNNNNNQIALINYLLNNDCITYSNGTWNYNIKYYPNWAIALMDGIKQFIGSNAYVSYDGILGSIIYSSTYHYYFSIINASYSSSTGLVFTITYSNYYSDDTIIASGNVNISLTTLNDSVDINNNNNPSNSLILKALTTYFNNTNNQIALTNYLLINNYVTNSSGTWSYYYNSNNDSGYSSWDSALNNGVSAFIYSNQNISYDGILGSNMYLYNNYNINYDGLLITNASWNSSIGLLFTITYNNISASNEIKISPTTLNDSVDANNNSPSNSSILNAFTTYFNNNSNKIPLVTYLINNNYITYFNGIWDYYKTASSLNSWNLFTSWDSALSSGIGAFISNNENVSYNGILGSTIITNYLSITNASYSPSSGLVFTIAYNGTNANSEITISPTTLNDLIDTNTNIVNALTSYFSNTNNQIALINYLSNNYYITYSNGTLYYSVSGLTNGISSFIASSQNVSYDGILGSSINVGQNSGVSDLSITNASYSSSTGLVFTIKYNIININGEITISPKILNTIK